MKIESSFPLVCLIKDESIGSESESESLYILDQCPLIELPDSNAPVSLYFT